MNNNGSNTASKAEIRHDTFPRPSNIFRAPGFGDIWIIINGSCLPPYNSHQAAFLGGFNGVDKNWRDVLAGELPRRVNPVLRIAMRRRGFLSPDGRTLITTQNSSVHIHDITFDGKLNEENPALVEESDDSSHAQEFNHVSNSPDGRTLLRLGNNRAPEVLRKDMPGAEGAYTTIQHPFDQQSSDVKMNLKYPQVLDNSIVLYDDEKRTGATIYSIEPGKTSVSEGQRLSFALDGEQILQILGSTSGNAFAVRSIIGDDNLTRIFQRNNQNGKFRAVCRLSDLRWTPYRNKQMGQLYFQDNMIVDWI